MIGWSRSAGASIASTARSLAGYDPTRRPCQFDPSARTITAPLALLMTWWLVTMWPSLSHTNPEPVPWGICWTSRLNGPAAVTRVVICTTEGDAVRKISVVVRSISARSPRAATGRCAASGSRSRHGLGMTVQIVHSASAATSTSRMALSPSRRRSNRRSLSMSAPTSSGGTPRSVPQARLRVAHMCPALDSRWRGRRAFLPSPHVLPRCAPRQAK